jgi:hypothetical protein
MRRPAKSRLFIVSNPGPLDPDSPEFPLESGPQRCVQIPFDLDSLPDVDDGENAQCHDLDGRLGRSPHGTPTSQISPVGVSSFDLWMKSQKLQ